MNIRTDIPHGNAAALWIDERSNPIRIEFTAAPNGGSEALWFSFRLEHAELGNESKDVLIVFKYFETVLGGHKSETKKHSITYRNENDSWKRSAPGKEETGRDGQLSLVWLLRVRGNSTDFALTYPYGRNELREFLSRQEEYFFNEDHIGLTQKNRELSRLSNNYGSSKQELKGIYFIARQHSGETPGSWALEGFLKRFGHPDAKDRFTLWGIPFADLDGVEEGDYGKDNFPHDLNRAWGNPPMRHETLVIMRDIQRWRERCSPCVSIDFHAPSVLENDGVYTFVPKNKDGTVHESSQVLAGRVAEAFAGSGLGAENFVRKADYPSRWPMPNFTEYSITVHGISSLSFEFPYSYSSEKLLLPDDYRRAGAIIAESLINQY